MRVVDEVCEAGRGFAKEESKKSYGFNEDLVKHSNYSYVLLMDGSTGLGKQVFPQVEGYNSAAQWFVHRFAELIEENIDSYIPLKELVCKCIDIMNEEYREALKSVDISELSEEDLRLMEPSASMVLLRKREDKIDYLSLGDLCVLVKTCDGNISNISSDKVVTLDRQVIDKLQKLCIQKNIDIAEGMKCQEIKEALYANRLLKNTDAENGYWILGFDKKALEHAETKSWEDAVYDKNGNGGEYIDSMLVCSDGFSAYYDTYNLIKAEDGNKAAAFFELAANKKLKYIYKKLRRVENNDKLCNKFPRFKKSDDASAVMIHFRNRIRTYDKEDKNTKLNIGINRLKGRVQSAFMSFGFTKSAIVTVLTTGIAILYNLLQLIDRTDSESTQNFEMLTGIGVIITSLYTIITIVSEYKRRADGTLVFMNCEKRELQKQFEVGSKEQLDGFEIKQFYNGKDKEYYIESESFNRFLCENRPISFREIKRAYELPDEVKPLVPTIMEATFRKPNLIFNGKLLRQTEYITVNGVEKPSVLLQKTDYFSGQCSHEIVYKQFMIPGNIGVGFEGKKLLISEEQKIYDLSHSPCANFLGASTMVVTRDHKLIIGKQALYSKANKGRFAPSGSGSVDYADIKRACKYYNKSKNELSFNDILTYAMEREFCEECNFDLDKARKNMSSMLIGYVRLLERGGKPDYFGISYLNEDIKSIQMDIRKSEYGLVGRMLTVHFDSYNEIPDILEEFCATHTDKCRISIQLYLVKEYLKAMRAEGKLQAAFEKLEADVLKK